MIEIIAELIVNSMGMVADSLDILTNDFVYGINFYTVVGTFQRKKNIGKIAGYFQLILAVTGFIEVIRRFVVIEAMPDFRVSVFALITNATCLYFLM